MPNYVLKHTEKIKEAQKLLNKEKFKYQEEL